MGNFALRGVGANRKTELHIGADFGTTFSGAAFALVIIDGRSPQHDVKYTTLRQIEMITGYPDGEDSGGRDVYEVPTEILYQDSEDSEPHWGWEARTRMKQYQETHRWRYHFAKMVKLLLSEDERTEDIRQQLEEKFVHEKRSKIDILVDFLKPFHDHIIAQIRGFEGHNGNFDAYDRYWTFTVPAAWTAEARRDMKDAVRKAGFTGKSIKLISEPEAAALYILEDRDRERRDLKPDIVYVIGDLGGGTMDFAALQTVHVSPLSLKRLGGVTGCTIGSRNLEERFANHVGERLFDEFDYLERKSGLKREMIKQSAQEWFESKKKNFRGRNNQVYSCPIGFLRENAAKRFRNGFLEVSSDEVADIFDGIIEVICDCLVKQISKAMQARKKSLTPKDFAVKTIFLTGGLSANPYVYSQVQKYFEDESIFGHVITVARTIRPEQCVVKGAVWRSMNPEIIQSRTSETSYGFPQDLADENPWTYGGPDPERNPVTGELERKDRMKWVILKLLTNGKRFSYPMERSVPIERTLNFEECLFYSDKINRDKIHYLHRDIHQIRPLSFNLENWRNKFKVEENEEGLKYLKVQYKINSIVIDDEWEYEIEVFGQRTRFGGSTNIGTAFKLSEGAA